MNIASIVPAFTSAAPGPGRRYFCTTALAEPGRLEKHPGRGGAARPGLADRDRLALEVGQRTDRAVGPDDEMRDRRKQAADRAQLAQLAALGEQLDPVIGPAGEIGLGKARFDLAAVDQPQIVDRTRRRLRHRDETGYAASAAAPARRPLDRPGNRTGDNAADLEKTSAGRGRADPEIARLRVPLRRFRLRLREPEKSGGEKQGGAHQPAPSPPIDLIVRCGAAMGDNTIVDSPMQPGFRGIFVSARRLSGRAGRYDAQNLKREINREMGRPGSGHARPASGWRMCYARPQCT